ncbi:hypothetical protein TSARBOMBA_230 [Bacillus phage TsarBomba]|uniref:Uncharacterized protein n=1 Tax=Bacillus phage TsarBomba TaxID=1690456 RepID=A0A0K2CZT7_9CAUD|nr:hypothetical protein TSARBOMBA_230 [Bacillus phage TsarBomba]ALA13069.1 hypothetical protein TSARBOMBA_230 [Bacillus phage TsarBomba]
MHKIYVTVNVSNFDGEVKGIPYAGLNFDMAKERYDYGRASKIEVWLEGVHIETHQFQKVTNKEENNDYDWVKVYDRKDKLEEQIKKANTELEALMAAHILLQEEDKKCSTSLEKTAE